MLNTFIFHRVYHEDARYVMSAAGGLSEQVASELPMLGTGKAVVIGQMNSLNVPAVIEVKDNCPKTFTMGSNVDIMEVLDEWSLDEWSRG